MRSVPQPFAEHVDIAKAYCSCRPSLPGVLGHHGQIQHDKMLVCDGAVVVVDLAGDFSHEIVELHQSSGTVSISLRCTIARG